VVYVLAGFTNYNFSSSVLVIHWCLCSTYLLVLLTIISLVLLHRQWYRLHISEKFLSGT
jgi:hypothetical protein